ncbi:uncharacterized protein LOC120359804 [Solenopsis invicta]|uniref:uncharacterized protein LOC120359804 n=1 Tax=Solenopsis invicta TaxID=13686 RepID=UPI00193E1418|nr:uncharacterized protein LOC120359804 [Solenopsis invicta]
MCCCRKFVTSAFQLGLANLLPILFLKEFFCQARQSDWPASCPQEHPPPPRICFESLLFHIYLRDIGSTNARITRDKIQAALCGIQSYLFSKDLNVAPAKSQMMILEKRRKVSAIPPMPLHGEIVPIAEKVRFLGIMLDRTLSGREHLRFLC